MGIHPLNQAASLSFQDPTAPKTPIPRYAMQMKTPRYLHTNHQLYHPALKEHPFIRQSTLSVPHEVQSDTMQTQISIHTSNSAALV